MRVHLYCHDKLTLEVSNDPDQLAEDHPRNVEIPDELVAAAWARRQRTSRSA